MPPMPRAPSGMRQHAHRVKGAAGNLGMKALQETCALLEHNAKEGIWSAEMLPEIREVFAALQAYVAAVRQGSMINQSAPLAVPEVGSRASSGRAWRLRAARHYQGRGRPAVCPATASGARACRLQSRPWPRR